MAPQRTAAEQHKAAASGDGPTACTRAAAQQQQRATAEMAWPLLLQHDSIRKQLPVACKLLCCSKGLSAAVAEHSAGQLDVPRFGTAKEAQQAAPWLRKHARLVRSLDLRMFDPVTAVARAAATHASARLSPTAEACVAALAAAGPQSLALQSLKAVATDTTLPLLEQLPASRLAHLELQERPVQPLDQPASVTRVSAALGRLTALRSLELARRVGNAAAPMSGLSALTQLTALTLFGACSDLRHAPPQLLELKLHSCAEQQQQLKPLDLRHLAAATALIILRTPVIEGDVLPPNLLQLRVQTCRSVQPLLPLVQLRELRLGLEGDITADQLRQLSRLTALSLHYSDGFQTKEPASAGAWPLLPLQQLELEEVILSAPVCQHLAQLTGLSSLVLQLFELPQAGSAQQLAAALRQLSGLQQLELTHDFSSAAIDAAMAEEQQEETAGMRQLVQAVGGLQQLRDLCIKYLPELAAAAGANSSSLSALTALTGLSLFDCGVTDVAVASIVSQLPGLQSLDCSDNEAITDAALAAIAQLQQLTELSLYQCTGVTDTGLQHLAGLTRLRQVDV